ncbi:DUF3618 domain-containing protein [Xanthobacter oligotrophicus]|uniref:DUF3618 domain-containing protein n=1 Tax=Xanthobacter oligotrophicus TaxID=2607286 RepID=A0ABW6ZVL7_9HYPH
MADSNLAQDTRATIEAQIIELRNEMGRLSKSLQARASDAADDAEDAFESVKARANGAANSAAKTVRRQAHAVSEAIGENPGTAAAVLSSAGVMGLLVGFAAGYILASGSRR